MDYMVDGVDVRWLQTYPPETTIQVQCAAQTYQ